MTVKTKENLTMAVLYFCMFTAFSCAFLGLIFSSDQIPKVEQSENIQPKEAMKYYPWFMAFHMITNGARK